MSLKRTVVRGVLWTTVSSGAIRVLGIVGTLFIARNLDQYEYGVVMNWSNLVLFASALSTLGVGSYLLVFRDSTRDVSFYAAAIHIGLGLLTVAIILPLQDTFARWLGSPAIQSYLVGFSIAMLFDRIAHIPERLLTRSLQFVLVSNIRTLGEIVFSGVSVTLVLAGVGPIALVYGALARSGVKLVMFVRRVPRRDWLELAPPSSTIKRLVSFGAKIWPQTFSGYAVSRADNFFIASYFGPGKLAEYNLAYNFAEMPVSQVGEQMTDLLMPSFAVLAPERRPEAVLRVLGLVALVMFPLGFGLAAIADSLVAVAIGKPEWQSMGPMLSILAMLSVFRPLSGVLSSYLNALGRPGLTVMLELTSLAILLVLTPTLGRQSALWTSAIAISAFGIRAVLNMWVVGRLDGRSTFTYLATVAGPFFACVPMVFAVLGIRHGLLLSGVHNPLLGLLLEIVIGCLVYVGVAFITARSLAVDFIAMFRDALRRRSDY